MMTSIGPQGLFITTIGAHVVMIAFTLWRMTRRAAVAEEDKGAFQVSAPARMVTPETATLAAGEDEALPLEDADVGMPPSDDKQV
jgi:hypothetical protein